MECEVVVIPAGRMARTGAPTPEVICRSPASLLVKLEEDPKKKWMCIPHFSFFRGQGKVDTPKLDMSGAFVIAPGEVACAYNAECKRPVGGQHGAFVVKQPFTGHYIVVCGHHYDMLNEGPRLKVQPPNPAGGP